MIPHFVYYVSISMWDVSPFSVMNNAAMNFHVDICSYFSWVCTYKVESQGHAVFLFCPPLPRAGVEFWLSHMLSTHSVTELHLWSNY